MFTNPGEGYQRSKYVTDKQHPVHLNLPEQHPPGTNSPDYRPRSIAKWIKGLPLANTHETARQLHAFLQELNRTAIPSQDRFTILGYLQEPLGYSSSSLCKLFLGNTLPLSPRALQHLGQVLALHTESAIGYRIICAEQHAGKGRYDKKLLSYSLYHALRILGKNQLLQYQLYMPTLPANWGELHRLFQLAESRELLDIPIKDPENRHSKLNSINKAYKQLLLMELANPYHLYRGEAAIVYEALDRWAQYAELYITDGSVEPTALFYCQLDTELPPQHMSKQSPLEGENIRLLNLTRLAAVLENELEQESADDLHNPFTSEQYRDTLQRLLIAWKIRTSRYYPRIRASATVDISVGLSDTGQMISGKGARATTTSAELPQSDFYSELAIVPITDDLSSPGSSLLAPRMPENIPGMPPSTPAARQQAWTLKTINAGAGGYCLFWDQEDDVHAVVGELIGICDRPDDPQAAWSIGIVRWMQYLKGKGIKLGIQLLAPEATPGNLQYAPSSSCHCLLLPEVRDTHQPPSLITSCNTLKSGDSATLYLGQKGVAIKVTRLLERSHNLSRFLYTTTP